MLLFADEAKLEATIPRKSQQLLFVSMPGAIKYGMTWSTEKLKIMAPKIGRRVRYSDWQIRHWKYLVSQNTLA